MLPKEAIANVEQIRGLVHEGNAKRATLTGGAFCITESLLIVNTADGAIMCKRTKSMDTDKILHDAALWLVKTLFDRAVNDPENRAKIAQMAREIISAAERFLADIEEPAEK